MYFAILDRDRFPMTLSNSAARVELEGRKLSDPYYFFSITQQALAQRPYRRGWVYLLPRDTFEQQPKQKFRGLDIHLPQWASAEPVRPLGKLEVGPEDFPFLAQMRATMMRPCSPERGRTRRDFRGWRRDERDDPSPGPYRGHPLPLCGRGDGGVVISARRAAPTSRPLARLRERVAPPGAG
jgi:hypothetical protein